MDELRHLSLGPRETLHPTGSGGTDATARKAVARCRVTMLAATTQMVASNAVNKGDVLATARVAGIQAAKRASELLPMAHVVLVGNTYINFTFVDTIDRTGVEMEAMVAASIAGLTIYDMCKSSDRTMMVTDVALWEKSGGRSGPWRRDDLIDE